MYNIIALTDKLGRIVVNGKLPAENTKEHKKDLARFYRLTVNNTVIMGMNTYKTLKAPLKNRFNIVITSKVNGVCIEHILTRTPIAYVNSFETALSVANIYKRGNIWVIGGQSVYKQAIAYKDTKQINKILITVLEDDTPETELDLYMPDFAQDKKYMQLDITL